jgi:hypothetical protein
MITREYLDPRDIPSFEVSEEAPAPVTRTISKSKYKAPSSSTVTLVPAPSSRPDQTSSRVGSKRDLSARSPDKVEGSSKRTRAATRLGAGGSNIKNPPANLDSVTDESTLGMPVTQTTTTNTIPAPPTSVPSSVTDRSTAGSPITPTTAIFYSNVVAFDKKASDPAQTVVALEVLRSEICGIMLRERNEANAVLAKTNDRRLIWNGVLQRLDERIAGVSGLQVVESSDEGGVSGDVSNDEQTEDGSAGGSIEKSD